MTPHRVVTEREASDSMDLQPRDPIIYSRAITVAASRNASDTRRILEGTSINKQSLKQLDAGVSVDDYRCLLHNAKAVSGRQTILLEAGVGIPLAAHGVLGNAVSCSPDRMTVLDLVKRFIKLRGIFSDFHIQKSATKTRCRIELDPVLGEEKDSALDFMLAVLMDTLMFRGLLPMSTPRIQLMRAKPPEHAIYQKILCAKITYDQPEDCVIFDTKELELPLPAYDQDQFELAVRKCKMLLVDRVKLDSTREAIELVFEKSPGMLWTLNQVAARLYISARTLQRRLSTEGTNYQQVLDDWLKQLTAQYLETENLSVEATATLLGYNDEANFRRAFKRWHGCSPQAHRRQLQAVSVSPGDR